jgi:hypothetical protein
VERRPGTRLAEPAEDDPQHRVGVGGGADRGAGVTAHPLLVHDDRRRQPLQQVDLRARQRRHEALHEGAVGLVDQPLRLRGDRAEHQRALARAGDAGEHRQPALRDLDADVLEVVLARAVHADQTVAVGDVQRRRLRVRLLGHAHRASFCQAGPSSRSPSASPRLDLTSFEQYVWFSFASAGRASGPRPRRVPAEASDQPAAVAHELAVGQLVHLAPGLDAAQRDAEPAVRRGQCTRVEAGARGEPVTPLLRQRVDLEDLDFAIDHGHVAGVAQPQPNGSGGGEVPAGRAVRRRGHQQRLALPVEGQRHQVRCTVRRGTGHPDIDVVGEPMLGVATTPSAGAGVGTHRS